MDSKSSDGILKIFSITRKFYKLYFVTGALVILVALLNLANPVITGKIVDLIVDHIKNNSLSFNDIGLLLLLMVLIDISITVITNISGYLGDRLGVKLNTFLTSKFYRHVLSLEIEYFDNEISGKIMNKLQRGIDNITNFINQFLNNFLPFLLTAIFTIVFLAFFSIEIALLLAVLFPLYIIISEKSSTAWRKKQEKMNGVQDKLQGRMFESISAIRVVKSFLRENTEHKNYLDNRELISEISKKQSAEWHKFDVIRRLVLNIILFIIFAYIVYNTFNGRYTIGVMTLLLQLVNQARFPLFAMSFIIGQIQQAQSGSKDFFEVLNQEIQIKDKKDAKELTNVNGNIKFNNVSFAYKEGKEVLHSINFELNSGRKMAIVGESGEGKSTIANLLLRFYEPKSGEILIDEKNINDLTQESLHKNISVVLQDSTLFSGTIAENIKYGKPEASLEDIENAAKAANAHEFISSFEKGYDSEIGERGIKLSGGQKQRIAIARAILKNSPILILDEATSSLDSKAEFEVQKALDKLMEGKTTIIIAHRLATIKNVDQIIVLKKGDIAEKGSPAELLKQNGIYAELVNLQSSSDKKQENQEPHEKLKEFSIIG